VVLAKFGCPLSKRFSLLFDPLTVLLLLLLRLGVPLLIRAQAVEVLLYGLVVLVAVTINSRIVKIRELRLSSALLTRLRLGGLLSALHRLSEFLHLLFEQVNLTLGTLRTLAGLRQFMDQRLFRIGLLSVGFWLPVQLKLEIVGFFALFGFFLLRLFAFRLLCFFGFRLFFLFRLFRFGYLLRVSFSSQFFQTHRF